MDLVPGDACGDYRIVRCGVARGASGVVHEAVDGQGRRIALKLLDRTSLLARVTQELQEDGVPAAEIPERAETKYAAAIARLQEEYALLASLRHPHIVAAEQLGCHDGQWFIATAFVEGATLYKHCESLLPEAMLPLFAQLAEALAFLHQHHVLHLDIKPENVLVTMRDGAPCLQLIDFGLARAFGTARSTVTGSLPYIAPEIILGTAGDITERADLYSAAALMYLCVTWGRFPFPQRRGATGATARERVRAARPIVAKETTPSPPSQFRSHDLPSWIDPFLVGLLHADPMRRTPVTARAMADRLHQEIAATQPTQPRAMAQPGSRELFAALLRPPGQVHIGRAALQQRLRSALTALVAGEQPIPNVHLIVGESGLGKSHLLRTLLHTVGPQSASVAVHTLTWPAGDDWLAAWQTQVQQSLLGTRPVLVVIDDLDFDRPSTIAPLVQTLLHRTQDASLAAALPPCLLLATTSPAEPGAAPLDTQLSTAGLDATHVRIETLAPFDRDELAAYIAATAVLRDKPNLAPWIDRLLATTDGIPAEVVATIEQLDCRHALMTPDGELLLASLANPVEERSQIPTTTQERVLARYFAQDERTRYNLDALATWSTFDAAAPCPVATLQPLSNLIVGDLVTPLRATGLVEATADGLIWAPPSAAGVIYPAIPERMKEYWNNRWSTWARYGGSEFPTEHIETPKGQQPVTPGRVPLSRVCHPLAPRFWFHRGRSTSSRLTPAQHAASLLRVARWALQQGNTRLAARCTDDALVPLGGLDHPPSTRPHVHLWAWAMCLWIDTASNAGRTAEIRARESQLLATIPLLAPAWRLPLWIRLARQQIADRRFDAARENLQAAQAVAPPTAATIPSLQLRYLVERLHEREAAASSDVPSLPADYFVPLERLRDQETLIPLVNRSRLRQTDLAQRYLAAGHTTAAVTALREVLRRHRAEGDRFGQLHTATLLAEAHLRAGDHPAAVAVIREALRVADAIHHARWRLHARQLLVNAYYAQGDFAAAIAQARECLVGLACLPRDATQRTQWRYVWLQHGHCFLAVRGWERAQLSYATVLADGSDDALACGAHVGLASLAQQRSQWTAAHAHAAAARAQLAHCPPAERAAYARELDAIEAACAAQSAQS